MISASSSKANMTEINVKCSGADQVLRPNITRSASSSSNANLRFSFAPNFMGLSSENLLSMTDSLNSIAPYNIKQITFCPYRENLSLVDVPIERVSELIQALPDELCALGSAVTLKVEGMDIIGSDWEWSSLFSDIDEKIPTIEGLTVSNWGRSVVPFERFVQDLLTEHVDSMKRVELVSRISISHRPTLENIFDCSNLTHLILGGCPYLDGDDIEFMSLNLNRTPHLESIEIGVKGGLIHPRHSGRQLAVGLNICQNLKRFKYFALFAAEGFIFCLMDGIKNHTTLVEVEFDSPFHSCYDEPQVRRVFREASENYVLESCIIHADREPDPVREFNLDLNKVGRKTLIGRGVIEASAWQWAEVMGNIRTLPNPLARTSAMFYFLSLNPGLCNTPHGMVGDIQRTRKRELVNSKKKRKSTRKRRR
jgi:hypothetical protein